ncbi:MAG: hypothetical protein HRU11_10490 [Parvularculaceae bacterium]|nr:hypothetical protein [Parvularculaceae bacterium]
MFQVCLSFRTVRRTIALMLFGAAAACSSGEPEETAPADLAGVGVMTPDPAPAVQTLAHPGPETFRIGNAVAPINYYSTAWTLNDIFKQAGFEDEIGVVQQSRAWHPIVAGEFGSPAQRSMTQVDEFGWPTSMSLSDGTVVDQMWSFVAGGLALPDILPSGVYEVRWEGEGELSVMGAEVVSASSSSLNVSYDGESELWLVMENTGGSQAGNHLRNITMMRPDATEGTYHETYLDFIEPFSVIRPLHLIGEQSIYGPSFSWDQRKTEGYSHWGGAMGAPYEVAIEMANESNSDLWVNIPVAGSDAFFEQLAELTLARLDGEHRLYIELGNELWNGTEPYSLGAQYALEQAEARWPGVRGQVRPWSDGEEVNDAMFLFSWQGARTVEACAIFDRVWGDDADRLVCVISGQIGASAPFYFPNRFLLETPVYVGEEGATAAGDIVDAFAVAPYMSDVDVDGFEFDRTSAQTFFADATQWVRGEGRYSSGSEEEGLRLSIRYDRALADEFDLPLVAYEGGNHFVGSRFTRDTVSNHPLMYDLYRDLFDVWQEEGGGLFVHYGGILARGQQEDAGEPNYFESENFGIIERQLQPLADSPKLRAVLDVMEDVGQ